LKFIRGLTAALVVGGCATKSAKLGEQIGRRNRDRVAFLPGGRYLTASRRLKGHAEEIRAHQIQYAVVSVPFFELQRASFPEWLQRTKAEVVADFAVTVSVGIGAQHDSSYGSRTELPVTHRSKGQGNNIGRINPSRDFIN
jgi:hypothetical protein